MKTILELLEGYSESFKNSYKDHHNIMEIEGQIFDGEYCGYSFRPFGSDIKYFTEYGIRGFDTGKFLIKNGEPVKQKEHYVEIVMSQTDIELVYRLLKENNSENSNKLLGYLKRYIRKDDR